MTHRVEADLPLECCTQFHVLVGRLDRKAEGAHRVEAEHAVGLALDGVVGGALVHRVLRGWKQIKGVSRKHLTGGWLEAIQRG